MKKRKRVSWGRWITYLLLAVIVLRAGIMYQRWTRIYTNKSIEFANGLRNGAILLNNYQGFDFSNPIALDKLREGFAKHADSIGQTGASMDQMAVGRHGSLGRVGYGLTVYTSDILRAPHDETPGRFGEDVQPPTSSEAIAALRQVYETYVKHFTDRVIYSQSEWLHKRALDKVYGELAEKGLDRWLRKPLSSYMSID